MIVRRERPGDGDAAARVTAAAFSAEDGAEPVEVGLVAALRRDPGWIGALSWVAEVDGDIVGYGVCTEGSVGDTAAVGLGPIGVDPSTQRSGIGSALMHAMIGAADALGYPLIGLLGDPGYYQRFGFVTSTDLGIAAPDPAWGPHFQTLALSSWTPALTGNFRYAAPFDEL